MYWCIACAWGASYFSGKSNDERRIRCKSRLSTQSESEKIWWNRARRSGEPHVKWNQSAGKRSSLGKTLTRTGSLRFHIDIQLDQQSNFFSCGEIKIILINIYLRGWFSIVSRQVKKNEWQKDKPSLCDWCGYKRIADDAIVNQNSFQYLSTTL